MQTANTVRYSQIHTDMHCFQKCICACIHDKKTYTYALPLSNAYVYVSACMLACMYTTYMHICTWYSSCEPRYMQIKSNRCRYRYMHITYTLCITVFSSRQGCWRRAFWSFLHHYAHYFYYANYYFCDKLKILC